MPSLQKPDTPLNFKASLNESLKSFHEKLHTLKNTRARKKSYPPLWRGGDFGHAILISPQNFLIIPRSFLINHSN